MDSSRWTDGPSALRRARKNTQSSDNTGIVLCPNLLGALVVKSAAYTTSGINRERYLYDVVTLATLVESPKILDNATSRDENRLLNAINAISARPQIAASIDDGEDALVTLAAYIRQRRRRRELANNR